MSRIAQLDGRHVLVLAARHTHGFAIAARCLEGGARVTLVGTVLDDLNRALLARPELGSAALDPSDGPAFEALLRSMRPIDDVVVTFGTDGRAEGDDVVWPELGGLQKLVRCVDRELPTQAGVLLVHAMGPRARNGSDAPYVAVEAVRRLVVELEPRPVNLLAHSGRLEPTVPEAGAVPPPTDLVGLATTLLAGTTRGMVVEVDAVGP
ncbi:MAG: hypothetical protein AAF211_05685 [Myxococcota bacterium]